MLQPRPESAPGTRGSLTFWAGATPEDVRGCPRNLPDMSEAPQRVWPPLTPGGRPASRGGYGEHPRPVAQRRGGLAECLLGGRRARAHHVRQIRSLRSGHPLHRPAGSRRRLRAHVLALPGPRGQRARRPARGRSGPGGCRRRSPCSPVSRRSKPDERQPDLAPIVALTCVMRASQPRAPSPRPQGLSVRVRPHCGPACGAPSRPELTVLRRSQPSIHREHRGLHPPPDRPLKQPNTLQEGRESPVGQEESRGSADARCLD